jgi:photosystem II stability/assembly factor-like uncharacterized protein
MRRAIYLCLLFTACGEDRAIGLDGEQERHPLFVAVGASGTILSSSDGLTWSERRSEVEDDLLAIAAGPSGFVAVGEGGVVLTSEDGASWVRRASNTETDLSHVIAFGDDFAAVGGSWETGAALISSRGGEAWSAIDSPANQMFHAVARSGEALIAAAYLRSDLQRPSLFRLEGGTWTEHEGPDFYDSLETEEAVIVTGGTTVASSSDGATWERASLPSTKGVRSIARSESTFVLAGEQGAIYLSHDGKEWQEREAGLGRGWLAGATHGGSRFVVVGGNGEIITSSDGDSWTRGSSPTSAHLFDVAYR